MFFSVFSPDKGEQRGEKTIYEFKLKSLDGKEVDFAHYKGKKILIVNTASKCGYTPQYEGLEKLYRQYGDKVTVLGFPANDFLRQEPGSNAMIALFCKEKYDVTFPMFEKISVRGKNQHPLYRWLKAKTGKAPSWNFCKYLIDEKGKVINFYPSKVAPMDESILAAIR